MSATVPFTKYMLPDLAPLLFTSLSNVPAPSEKFAPRISRGDFVMMLTTPLSAFAPQTADAGPRITSICLISFRLAGMKSHMMNPKKS